MIDAECDSTLSSHTIQLLGLGPHAALIAYTQHHSLTIGIYTVSLFYYTGIYSHGALCKHEMLMAEAAL